MAANWKGTVLALMVGGAAGIFLAPIVAPALARASRPTLKAAVKAALAIYQRGRETAADLRETVEDVTAELAADQPGATPPAYAAATPGEHSPSTGAVH